MEQVTANVRIYSHNAPTPIFPQLVLKSKDLEFWNNPLTPRISPLDLEQAQLAIDKNLGTASSSQLRIELDPQGFPHPHGYSRMHTLEVSDFYHAINDIIQASRLGARELNLHLPLEVQFHEYHMKENALLFMRAVEDFAERLNMLIVWENVPIFNTSDWSLVKNTQSVPFGHALCLDIGHLMLGSKSKDEAIVRIDSFISVFGDNVRHLHLHINNFHQDQHHNDPEQVIEFLGNDRFLKLVHGRSYIFEKGL